MSETPKEPEPHVAAVLDAVALLTRDLYTAISAGRSFTMDPDRISGPLVDALRIERTAAEARGAQRERERIEAELLAAVKPMSMEQVAEALQKIAARQKPVTLAVQP